MAEERIKWIDWVKGFTMFLVVFGHICSGLYNSGRFLESEYYISLMYDLISGIRMPLFFLMSGLLYYTKVNNNKRELKNSILKKLISLGIPYIIFSVFVWFLKYFMGSNVRIVLDWTDLLLIPIKPIEYLWFLYALLLIFIIVEVLDYVFKNNIIVLCIVFAITIICWSYPTESYLLNQTMRMITFFYMGKMLRQNIAIFKDPLFFILCISAYIILQYVNIVTDNTERSFNFVIAMAGAFAVLGIAVRLNEKSAFFRYFCKIGKITMPVYLLHPPIASATRMFLLKIGIENIIVHFVLGFLIVWFLTMGIYKIASKFKYGDFLFYPGKYIKIKT